MTRLRLIAGATAFMLMTGPARADLVQSSGKITFLRVHDVGTGFGPPTDFIDALARRCRA